MNRLEQLGQHIDNIIRQNPDQEESRCGFVHLYGVSGICTLLALKRGLDPELCSVTGMLHDIWNYKISDCPEHGQLGAIEAEKILKELRSFSQAEIEMICEAIARHSNKQAIDSDMAELLKDADVFQHYLYNPQLFDAASLRQLSLSNSARPRRFQRLEKVMRELNLKVSPWHMPEELESK